MAGGVVGAAVCVAIQLSGEIARKAECGRLRLQVSIQSGSALPLVRGVYGLVLL